MARIQKTAILLSWLTCTAFAGGDSLRISEVSLDGAAGPRNVPWVEIANSGAFSVNLKGYGVADLIGRDAAFVESDLMLDAGGVALVHLRATAEDGGWLGSGDHIRHEDGDRLGYLECFSRDPRPDPARGLVFLVLTRTPGAAETSLRGAVDLLVIATGKRVPEAAVLERYHGLIASGCWDDPAAPHERPQTWPPDWPIPVAVKGKILARRNLAPAEALPGRAGAWVSRAPHQATPGWDGKPAGRFSLSVHPGILNGDAGSTAAIRIGGIPGAVWSLAVYRLDGSCARVLETADAGNAGTTVFWDGCDQENRRLPPGVYLIRLDALDPSGGNRASLVRPLVLGGIP